MIVIVDYGMGNLASVARALEAVGAKASVSSKPEDLEEANGLILPGVGAYGEGMENLRRLKLVEALDRQVLQKKKPFLGICLGMQLLSTVGYEFGQNKGLGWITGETKRLETGSLRLPHIGWNNVEPRSASRLWRGIPGGTDFYFVHSYAFAPEDAACVAAACDYGTTFAAAVESGNIFGVQFHPEKSQDFGLKILKNFAEIAC